VSSSRPNATSRGSAPHSAVQRKRARIEILISRQPILVPIPKYKMSIETPTTSATPLRTVSMASDKLNSKGDKKHKSSHGEKKRKRDHKEDGHKSKSKKLKSDRLEAIARETPYEASDDLSKSPFHMQTASMYLPLAPISQKYPLEGLCAEHLSPLILQYYPPFNGVILAYDNPRSSEKPFGTNSAADMLFQNIDEYAVSWTWVTAEFLVFKMESGVEIEAYVNLQNEGHLGLVCWNLFNASIERKRLPADWIWIGVAELEAGAEDNYALDGAGHYVDGEGNKIEGKYTFRIKDVQTDSDPQRGFVSIEGTMLGVDDELVLAEKERNTVKKPTDLMVKRVWPSKAVGATILGIPREPDEDDGRRKHRQKY
jgi:DNA-directed RNA polymerase I subunit RPA43